MTTTARPSWMARPAWALFLAAAVVVLLALGLLAVTRSAPLPPASFGFRGFPALFALTFGAVGALIASHQPRNTIGWLLLVTAVLSALHLLAAEYAVFGLVAYPGLLPLAREADRHLRARGPGCCPRP